MKHCCTHGVKDKQCIRSKDKKVFSLPCRFTRKRCVSKPIKGFTMRSSCAPYLSCKQKRKRKSQKLNKSRKTRKWFTTDPFFKYFILKKKYFENFHKWFLKNSPPPQLFFFHDVFFVLFCFMVSKSTLGIFYYITI